MTLRIIKFSGTYQTANTSLPVQIIPDEAGTVTDSTDTLQVAGTLIASTAASPNLTSTFGAGASVYVKNKSNTTGIRVLCTVVGVSATNPSIPVPAGEALYMPSVSGSNGVFVTTASGTAEYYYCVAGIGL